MNFKVKL